MNEARSFEPISDTYIKTTIRAMHHVILDTFDHAPSI